MSTQSLPEQDQNIAVLWDMVTCPVPNHIYARDAAGNIRTALKVHPQIIGAVNFFSAYGDFNVFPQRIRTECEKTGVKCTDVPKHGNDSVYEVVLFDILRFTLDNPAPACILLISGNDKFRQTLLLLRERGYTVILAIPSPVGAPSALRDAGSIVWDWPSLPKTSSCWLNWLKHELVSLLESASAGGQLSLDCLANEYQRTFNRRLVSNETLLNLLKKMSGKIEIKVEGRKKTVHSKKFLPRSDVDNRLINRVHEELDEVLGKYLGGVPMSCLYRLEDSYQLEFKRSLDYDLLRVKNIEEVLHEMCKKGMALVSENPKSKNKYAMSVRMVEKRQELVLKRNVKEILYKCSGKIPLDSFEDMYKAKWLVDLNYGLYGLTGFDNLCEVLNLEVTDGELGDKFIKECPYNLRRRKTRMKL